jgi:hypothetical protein
MWKTISSWSRHLGEVEDRMGLKQEQSLTDALNNQQKRRCFSAILLDNQADKERESQVQELHRLQQRTTIRSKTLASAILMPQHEPVVYRNPSKAYLLFSNPYAKKKKKHKGHKK